MHILREQQVPISHMACHCPEPRLSSRSKRWLLSSIRETPEIPGTRRLEWPHLGQNRLQFRLLQRRTSLWNRRLQRATRMRRGDRRSSCDASRVYVAGWQEAAEFLRRKYSGWLQPPCFSDPISYSTKMLHRRVLLRYKKGVPWGAGGPEWARNFFLRVWYYQATKKEAKNNHVTLHSVFKK